MIVHKLTLAEEDKLRNEYVKNMYKGKILEDYDDYKNYVINIVPGVITAAYCPTSCDYLAELVFDSQGSLAWFLLKYS